MLSDQPVKQRDPGQTLSQPLPDQQPPSFVFDLNIVMGLSPIVADEQYPVSSLMITMNQATEKACYDLMDQCSPARHPTSTTGLLTTCRAHDLVIDLNKAGENGVLTGSQLGQQHAPRSSCRSPIRGSIVREEGFEPGATHARHAPPWPL